ncbi:MAG TPA: sirohydrochlorin chelatase [Chondromyces sp.]|nr:sirohydrochlorin chelatase [Chondromyces sp.]
MKAVLYICHGSRIKKGCEEALQFIEQIRPSVNAPIQEACFLELAEPSIEEGIARCVAKGATDITVIPFLLLLAGHAKVDIPQELEKAEKQFPEVQFRYGEPLGVHDAIIDIMLERMMEHQIEILPDATVLIVGRGSSDPQTLTDFAKIKALFKAKTKLNDVNVCFLAAAEPKFKAELHRLAKQNPSQLWVLPYLLFTGILMKSMQKEIRSIDNDSPIYLCHYLGYHPYLRDILIERIKEVERTGGKTFPSSEE